MSIAVKKNMVNNTCAHNKVRVVASSVSNTSRLGKIFLSRSQALGNAEVIQHKSHASFAMRSLGYLTTFYELKRNTRISHAIDPNSSLEGDMLRLGFDLSRTVQKLGRHEKPTN